MQVRIDGKLVERKHYIEHEQTSDRSGFGYILPREEPELEDGEQAIWALGDPVPTIIRTFDPA
ncbi:hypothetical protein [Pseudomonas sp. YL2]|uniref:hypothetical protein n=1 Tax=Pseudomonas sp. YL2 TaxID=2904251 RepID=UPI001FF4AE7C|nr:hypothetical protein [Pseudomonas sp. YL2]